MSLDDDHLIEKVNRESFKRAPFIYVGKKFEHLGKILPHLPVREVWCEAFGGSGVVTLNRPKSKLEVYNDRYSGVVSFYRCIRDETLCKQLVDRLKLTLYSREEYQLSKDWEDVNDPVERAAKWYTLINQSFGAVGRSWGRGLQTPVFRSYWEGLDHIPDVVNRFKYVQVENLDWEQCLKDYDSSKTVFYLDPPYFATDEGAYSQYFSRDDHRRLVNKIFDLKGFVALSGYETSYYDTFPWDEKFTWAVQNSQNKRSEGVIKTTTECLWIKEAT